jgi:hypothetical protein
MLNMEVTYSTAAVVKPQFIIGFYFQKVYSYVLTWKKLSYIDTENVYVQCTMYNVLYIYITCALYIFKLLILQHGLKSETIK